MNFLQRFSIALARRGATGDDAGRRRNAPGGSGIEADWLGEVKSLAGRLPPANRRPDNTGE